MKRVARPKKFAVLSGSKKRVVRNSAIVSAPTAASATGFAASRRCALVRRSRRFMF
jgi:hypothetical protein